MRKKNYIFVEGKHDRKKLTRAFYTKNHVAEVNNPEPVFDPIELQGEKTLDERVREMLAKELARQNAIAERNSVTPINEMLDFEIGDPDDFSFRTEYEMLDEIVDLNHDNQMSETTVTVDLPPETPNEPAVEPTPAPEPAITEPPSVPSSDQTP